MLQISDYKIAFLIENFLNKIGLFGLKPMIDDSDLCFWAISTESLSEVKLFSFLPLFSNRLEIG